MSPQTPALRNTAIALALSILCCAQAPMPEPVTDQETELGDQMYKELKAKGGDRRILPALRHIETDSRLDFPGGSVALSASLQVLHRSRASA